MNKKKDFELLVEKAMQATNYAHMRPVISKELLHYDILYALDKENFLEKLTFQGGTCLRLCYNASRFSEDLDFVGGEDFSTRNLLGMKQCLENYIGDRYGLDITVKEPKVLQIDNENRNIDIAKWQIKVVTSPEKRDLPKQMIKIEVAKLSAYSRVPRTLQRNYDFLPDGYGDMLILTETLDEIMADKLISVANCQKYVRHRDIWDLRWLKQQGANIKPEYIIQKIRDYKIEDYSSRLDTLLEKLNSIIHGKAFLDEMLRFVPLDAQERTLKKPAFLDLLESENRELLLAVAEIVGEA